jgi:cytochrome c-type biogenesis protein CcmH/NrfF
MKGLILLLIVLGSQSTIVSAIDLTPEQRKMAEQVFSNTMSPYCPGRLLSDCPSTSASELKEKLRERIASGETADDINLYLESIYGQAIHATPPARGFGLFAWLTPAVFFILGLTIFKIWLGKNRLRQSTVQQQATPAPTKWDSEIDKELKD